MTSAAIDKTAFWYAIAPVVIVAGSIFLASSCGKDDDLKPNQVSLTSKYVDLKVTAKTVTVGEAKAAFTVTLQNVGN
jgi:hypothetical protein